MIPIVYDQINGWGKHDEFFLALLQPLKIEHLADLGCGTGRLTTYFSQAGYSVTAIDPNEEAIAVAQAKVEGNQVEWRVGDSSDLQTAAYDAVVMTANVAQVFLTEESWRQVIADVYRALQPGGHFIFDTRNPLAEVWKEWEKDLTPDEAKDPITGEPLEIWTTYDGFIEEIYTFFETVKKKDSEEVLIHETLQLKFRSQQELEESLRQVGFSHIQMYGDWTFDRATEEAKSFIVHAIKEK